MRLCHGLPGPPSRRQKETVCVLCPRSDMSGSCLLRSPLFLSGWIWGPTLPGARRSNDTAKKQKMNNYPTKDLGQQLTSKMASSPPQPRSPVKSRIFPLKHSHTRCVQSSCHHLVKSSCCLNPKDPGAVTSVEGDFFPLPPKPALDIAIGFTHLYRGRLKKESCVRMKQFTMQIEACEGMDAAITPNSFCTLNSRSCFLILIDEVLAHDGRR
uniref:uncharacterized protein LOC123454682 isoform X2 n=1 Tax=Jaculus jaculus TaxID=51337 RepID=UPI001E1B0E09|nr:uncharacterized protein LOC123454682 isoform X2 [Jaculus jaculus]